MSACPDQTSLARFSEGLLDAQGAEQIRAHLAGCERCRRALDDGQTFSNPSAGSAAAPAVPPAGERLERFVLLEHLGAGGMGSVWSAWDTRLERRVALKMVKPGAAPGVDLQASLLNEARAMAKLAHPNVVLVFDAFVHGNQVVVAMEHIEGQTLRAWIERGPGKLAAVLPMLVGAGQGLAAAHAHGVLHRDFKPENVFVDQEGRARVGDFGLARTHASSAPSEKAPGDSGSLAVTSISGTRGYIAPEVLALKPFDGRADQFAFCVTAWECLTGARPGPGNLGGKIPAALRRALERGLQENPDLRWPSMPALLVELERIARWPRRRRRWALAGLGLVALAALVAHEVRAERRACAEGREVFAQAFSPDRRGELRAAFERSGLPDWQGRLDALSSSLEQRGRAWLAAWDGSCPNLRASSDRERQRAEASAHCALRRLHTLDALTALWPSVPRDVLAGGADPLAELRGLRECRGDLPSDAALPEDPAKAVRFEELRARLDRLDALMRTGPSAMRQAADAELAQLVAQAKDAGDLEALASGEFNQARRRCDAGDSKGCVELAAQALDHALTAGDAETGAVAAIMIARELATVQRRYDEADFLAGVSEALLARAGRPPVCAATVAVARGEILKYEERFDEAAAWFEQAIALRTRLFGADSLAVTEAQNNLANDRLDSGSPELARPLLERALEVRRARFGPKDASLMAPMNNLGRVLLEVHENAAALRLYDEADALMRELFGARHGKRWTLQLNHARALRANGRFDEADLAVREVRELATAQFGKESVEAARADVEDALTLLARGRPREALPLAERAVALSKAGAARAHELAEAELTLAETLHAAGVDPGRARTLVAAVQAALDSKAVREVEIRRRAAAAAEALR